MNMASIKCDCKKVGEPFEIKLADGWLLQIEKEGDERTSYTINHGKKSMTFNSEVMRALCHRKYGIRLTKGRRQMKLPSEILDSVVEYTPIIEWIDSQPALQIPPPESTATGKAPPTEEDIKADRMTSTEHISNQQQQQ